MDKRETLVKAATAIKDLSAERDMLKMALERQGKISRVLGKMVDDGVVKTAAEYMEMKDQLERDKNEEIVEKALELFPSQGSSLGKVAEEKDLEGLSAKERFVGFLLS